MEEGEKAGENRRRGKKNKKRKEQEKSENLNIDDLIFTRHCDKALYELQYIHHKLELFNDSVHSQKYIVAL